LPVAAPTPTPIPTGTTATAGISKPALAQSQTVKLVTLPEFFTIVTTNRKKLLNTIKKTIQNNLKKTPDAEELELKFEAKFEEIISSTQENALPKPRSQDDILLDVLATVRRIEKRIRGTVVPVNGSYKINENNKKLDGK
jgi:signal transduction histidine kinase